MERHQCKYCDYSTVKILTFENHNKTWHKEQYKIDNPKNKIEWIKKCITCDLKFECRRDSEIHMLTKKHLDKFLNIDKECCLHCSYKTSKASTLKRHFLQRHPVEYKYSVMANNLKESTELNIPENNIKVYKNLVLSSRNLHIAIAGTRSKKNRNCYRQPEDPIMDSILTKLRKQKSEKKKIDLQIQELIKLNPDIIKTEPDKTIYSDEEEFNECIREMEEFKILEKVYDEKNDKMKYIQDISDKIDAEITELQIQFDASKGCMSFIKKIKLLEIEKNNLYKQKK